MPHVCISFPCLFFLRPRAYLRIRIAPLFFHLLAALKKFAAQPPHTLPLSSTLPDMKASTDAYIGLQKLYKDQAEREKAIFRSFISPDVKIGDDLIDSFVKNAHALRVIRGSPWVSIDENANALGKGGGVSLIVLFLCNMKRLLRHFTANTAAASPKQLAIHLALSAASSLESKNPTPQGSIPVFTIEALTQEAQSLLPPGTELPEEFEHTVGEMYLSTFFSRAPATSHVINLFFYFIFHTSARSPSADIPNTAAFLGGLVAQEVIKMITKQYIPISGVCTVDLIETWTGTL